MSKPPPPQEAQEGFLQRWSRVKQESTATADAAAAPPVEVPTAEGEHAAPETPPLTDADMPPLESLHAQSDLQPFLSRGVSDNLRRKAFRKIFLGEKFNIRDGLDDYDEDFTQFAALGDVVTAEYRRWQERMQKAQEEKDAQAGADAQDAEHADAQDNEGEEDSVDDAPANTTATTPPTKQDDDHRS